jgi:hypothetical protein
VCGDPGRVWACIPAGGSFSCAAVNAAKQRVLEPLADVAQCRNMSCSQVRSPAGTTTEPTMFSERATQGSLEIGVPCNPSVFREIFVAGPKGWRRWWR